MAGLAIGVLPAEKTVRHPYLFLYLDLESMGEQTEGLYYLLLNDLLICNLTVRCERSECCRSWRWFVRPWLVLCRWLPAQRRAQDPSIGLIGKLSE